MPNPVPPRQGETIDPLRFGRPAADTCVRLYATEDDRNLDIGGRGERGQVVARYSPGPDGPGMPPAPALAEMYDGTRWPRCAIGEPCASALMFAAGYDARVRYDLGVPLNPANAAYIGRLEPWSFDAGLGVQLFGIGLRPGGPAGSVNPPHVYEVTACSVANITGPVPIPRVQVVRGGNPTSGGGVVVAEGDQSMLFGGTWWRSTAAGLFAFDGADSWPSPLYVRFPSTPGTVTGVSLTFSVRYLGPLAA